MKLAAIQGIRGSYSEEAALQMLGASVELIECSDFSSTFEALRSKRAKYAVAPLRNKIVGPIDAVAELLGQNEFEIIEEFDLKINHILAGPTGAVMEDVHCVISHSEALKQCSLFLAGHPHITCIVGGDTASSVSRVVRENVIQNAAIGSVRAAKIYGANILCENISNEKNNRTTFGLITLK